MHEAKIDESTPHASTSMDDSGPRDGGLLAEFSDPTTLAHACARVRDAGYRDWDVHSPFPIHGIDAAIGIKPTRLPWIIFGAGITGTSVALLLQWWSNAVGYPFLISGKPLFSLPANIPVTFELTVLFAALTAFFATLGRNGLPRLHHPLFNSDRFRAATSNAFFIAISARDSKYQPEATRILLEDAGAKAVEPIADDSHTHTRLPRPLVVVLAAAFVIGFIPLGVIARARARTSERPRIHVVPDMDYGTKLDPQAAFSALASFNDGRAMRAPMDGTLAREDLRLDEHLHQGLVDGAFAMTLPPSVPLTLSTLERGRERYDIFCSPCHASAGYGNGMVAERATQLGAPKWVPPTNLHEARIREQPPGQIYNTITHGIRNMPAYGHAIPVRDRWTIVAYIRALQLSQAAGTEDVPADQRTRIQ